MGAGRLCTNRGVQIAHGSAHIWSATYHVHRSRRIEDLVTGAQVANQATGIVGAANRSGERAIGQHDGTGAELAK